MRTEPALRFWFDYIDAAGGAVEVSEESALVLVPPQIQANLDLPEEVVVTDDVDVAREEGSLLMIPGQPLLTAAAESVLDRGDVGWAHLPWPASPPPSRESLQGAARDHFTVDHGRIDVDSAPIPRYLPVLALGVVVLHDLALGDRFQERAEVWVDARTGWALPTPVIESLTPRARLPGPGRDHAQVPARLVQALRAADAQVEQQADDRRAQLSRDKTRARVQELRRVDEYYNAALAAIAKRQAAAAPERRALYDAQAEATKTERARRLQETEEKFAGRSRIRPFRLHLINIPGLVVPVTVRRGPHTYPLELSWYLPFATWSEVLCPQCDEREVLVAGRDRLGCRACLGTRHVR